VGILGFGEIGAELARRLRPFCPARVLYAKRRRLPSSVEEELGLVYASQDELVAASDFLCSLLPYYPETDHLLDAVLLARMKPGSFLAHCGSGSVIDEGALAAAIRQGHLAGAALDTYEWEPIRPDNPLLPLARDPAMNVLLTPHTAAGAPRRSGERDSTSRREEYTNILRMVNGEPLLYQLLP
jgi:lactate dehydrogenase-like 2-hydroxyacid dehydrogenase